METLLSVDAARARILSLITPVSTEVIPFDEAAGRVLARDIHSPLDLPPFANSAMDGFAVVAGDLQHASSDQPARLEVIGEVAAGHLAFSEIKSGQAVAISTGAALPAGADAVVPVEWVAVERALDAGSETYEIEVSRGVQLGQFVRPAGQAVAAGELVLDAGRRIRPVDIGMLASIGWVEVEVFRRPRVALFSSGDELVEPDQPLAPGKIHDSNRYTLSAAIRDMGAEAVRLPVAADSEDEVRARLEEAVASNPDLILSSAGVSVGEHDHVRTVVQAGGELDFWKVNIRPGKPIAFGQYCGIPFLGLPGNPVSMLVTYELFVQPAIAALMGLREATRICLKARLREAVESDGRESYLRGIVFQNADRFEAVLTGSQDSGILSSMVKANALLRIPAGVKHVPAGEWVQAYLLAPPLTEIQES